MEDQALKIQSLFIFLIKSCRGISVPQATATQTGFEWDRYWLVVDYKGRACTQKVEPKLALVESELPKEAFLEDWEPTKNSFLVVQDVSMWEWSGSAFDEGEEAAKWFSDYLGKQSRLVRFSKGLGLFFFGYTTTFANTFPLMVASQASLDKLNTLLSEPVPMNRCIIVDNCDPFGEDLWDEVKINDLVFQGVRLCSRCKLPTVNQETGVPDATETIETLMKFRSDKVLMPHKKPHGKFFFGKDMVWNWHISNNSQGKGNMTIKFGDSISVTRKIPSRADAAV
ncbi:hypothetical protein N665_0791s0025 [Sinapis alba]|nr:hypothetical protein N665_0791s0025 [Sinapis alba]